MFPFFNTAVDIIGVYTSDFVQVFPRARPLKAVVKEDSKVMEHPVENGATITDHRIILPVEIELSLILQAADYRDTYYQIKHLFLDATLLIVQTKTDSYVNQLISSLPHEEDPALYDAIAVSLKLKQVLFANTISTFVPRSNSNKSTTDRGNIQPATASPSQTSYVGQLIGRAAPA